MLNYRDLFSRLAIFLFVLGLSIAATGCEEDISATDDPVMQATVNDNSWSAGSNVDGTIFSSLKTITGAAGDGSSITLSLTNVTSTGTVDVDGTNATAAYAIGTEVYTATNGTVTVTALDAQNNISGTFEFDGQTSNGDEVQVKNGTFVTTLR